MQLAFLSLAIALLSSGCSLTMSLPGFSSEEETTASIPQSHPPFPVPFDEEDWRRVNAALSLAVDPQGAGLPVNWDNPGSRRRGMFEQSGALAVVGHTICRPFRAKVIDASNPKLAPVETLHSGQACRTGPGEWAMRDIKPGEMIASNKADEKKLPPAIPAMLPIAPRRP